MASRHALHRLLGLLCVVGGVAAIALATLVPLPGQATASADSAFFCFPCGEIGGVDIIVNILLFLPLGLGLRLLGLRWSVSAVIAATVSGTVELLQATVIAGRDAAFSDIVSNSIGGGLGAALGVFWWQLVLPQPHLARRLAWSAAGLISAVMGISAYFLMPSWPATPWWGQWQPRHLHTADFLGTVIDARIAGLPIPSDSLRQGDSIRAALLRGAPIEATVITGLPTATTAPILRLAYNDNEVAMISQSRLDVVLRIRLRTANALLKTPSVRLGGVLPDQPGDTVRIFASYFGNEYRIKVSTGGRVSEAHGTMYPSLGWTVLLPLDYAMGDEARWFGAMWLAVLFVPLGYWVGFARWSTSQHCMALASLAPIPVAAVTSLTLVPVAFGFDIAGGAQWLGAITGAGIGALVARLVGYAFASASVDDQSGAGNDADMGASSIALGHLPADELTKRTSPEYERQRGARTPVK